MKTTFLGVLCNYLMMITKTVIVKKNMFLAKSDLSIT